jgi:UDP-N-acetylmuramyl pentapeptide phosphotransferase/UDP-N-acetylglucosamine-1-phosphate transferase
MDYKVVLIITVICFLSSYLLTVRLIKVLRKKNIVAIPNSRSNHIQPTPIGGGLAIIASFFLGCLPLVAMVDSIVPPILIFLALAILCIISFKDDIKHVSIGLRLFTHFIAAIIGASVIQHNGSVFQGILPTYVEYTIIVLIIVTFMNLFNFMDGIDGMTGAETMHLCLSSAMILYLINNQSSYIFVALILAASTAGFLVFNWHPAKIFIGDAGSITLGYILSLLLLVVAAKGAWVQALILPMYYFADAGFVLLKRAICLEKIWQAHSKHFFQLAVRAGISHAEVVIKVVVLNIILTLLSLVAFHYKQLLVVQIGAITWAIILSIMAVRLLPIKVKILDIKAKRKQ